MTTKGLLLNKRAKAARGFSLVEVLLALLISSFLLIGFLQMFDKQNMSYKIQSDLVAAQENLRMAAETVVRDIRMTGYGLVDRTLSLTATNNTNSADMISIRSASLFSPSYSLGTDYFSTPSANSITLGAGQGSNFQANDFIVIRGNEGEDMVVINQVNGDVLTMTHPLATDYAATATTVVHKVDTISFRINNNNLERQVNNDGWQVLAEEMEDLQFAYLPLSSDPTNPGAWLNSPVSVLDVRMIRVSLIARTASEDPDLRNTGNNRRPALEDRGSAASPDGHRRRMLSSEVKLRNMYL